MVRRVVRIDGDRQEPAVPVIEHLGLAAPHRLQELDPVLDEANHAALLGHQDPPVGSEGERRRVVEAHAGDRVLDDEVEGSDGRTGRGGEQQRGERCDGARKYEMPLQG